MDFRLELMAEMTGLKTVDCHSHTALESEYREAVPLSLFSMGSYFDRDIQSTLHFEGGGGLYNGCTSDAQRWARLRGILDKARNVSYWRHNIVAYQGLFGLAEAISPTRIGRRSTIRSRRRPRSPTGIGM